MSSNSLCDVFRPSGPHFPLTTQSPYDTSLTGYQISSGFGTRPAALFFGKLRGWPLRRQLWLNGSSSMLMDRVVPLTNFGIRAA